MEAAFPSNPMTAYKPPLVRIENRINKKQYEHFVKVFTMMTADLKKHIAKTLSPGDLRMITFKHEFRPLAGTCVDSFKLEDVADALTIQGWFCSIMIWSSGVLTISVSTHVKDMHAMHKQVYVTDKNWNYVFERIVEESNRKVRAMPPVNKPI